MVAVIVGLASIGHQPHACGPNSLIVLVPSVKLSRACLVTFLLPDARRQKNARHLRERLLRHAVNVSGANKCQFNKIPLW